MLGGKWGLQGAFDFTTISVNDSQPINGTATFISDAYSLGAVIPPPAPYAGSYNGPGPLLGDTPDADHGVNDGDDHRPADAGGAGSRLSRRALLRVSDGQALVGTIGRRAGAGRGRHPIYL